MPQFFESQSRTTYRVRSGDFLGKIARKYGVRVSQIKQWNGLRSNNIRIGQRLSIYPNKPYTPPSSTTSKASVKTVISGNITYYIVKEGDS